MRRMIIFVTIMLLFAGGVLSFASQVYGQSAKKVLMIPREGYTGDLDLMLKMELGVMNLLLKRAGFQVDIATTSGFPIVGNTEKIPKLSRLVDIKLDDYVGVIMVCMGVGAYPGPPVSQEAIAIAKKALADGKPEAASTWATTILAEGGLLKGKKYAASRDPLKTDANFKLTDLRYEGGIYSGPGIVQDGKLITSGACPWMQRSFGMADKTVELTQTFILAIGGPK
jgi:putative intracellular protease/amidase